MLLDMSADHAAIFADLAVPASIYAVTLTNGVIFDSPHLAVNVGGETFDGLNLQAMAISADLAGITIENMTTSISITDPVTDTDTEYLIVSARPDGRGLTRLELTEA